MPVVTDYTALLSGSYWNGIEATGAPVIVTYSFPTAIPSYDTSIGGFTAATVASYQPFTDAEKAQARTALGEWTAASGLVFLEVAPGKGDLQFGLVDFDTTAGPSYSGAGGIGFYPFGNWNFFSYPSFFDDLDSSGEIFMNTRYADGGTVNYGTLLHEIGHAIGLKHPTETVYSAAGTLHDQVLDSDDPARTVMAEVGDGTPAGDVHLKALDKDAAAFLYGPAGTGGVHTGSAAGANAVSTWSWDAAAETLTQTGDGDADVIRGSSLRDVIVGQDGADRLFGLAGNDSLTGGAGNDSLFGGSGIDTLVGGADDDSYYVNATGATLVEAAVGGSDAVYATVTFTLPDEVETLSIFGIGLTGTGNGAGNSLFGDGVYATRLNGLGGGDYMVGGAAADTLDGGAGVDTMYGGGGNDAYYVDEAADAVFESASAGTDTVYAAASFTLAAGQEIEALRANAGATPLTLTGNEFANTVTGGGGADRLYGGGGNDVLSGGLGPDTMEGGANNDLYVVDNADDRVVEALGGGKDTVSTSVDYTLGAGQEIETLQGAGTAGLTLAGNELANTLLGGSGNDRLLGGGGADALNGGVGADTMEGGAQNDTYFIDNVGDRVIEAAGAGIDTVFAFVDFTAEAGQGIEAIRANSGAGLTLTGNEGANNIYGGAGGDRLFGGGGADVLVGNAGADTMDGGTQNDSYYVDNGGDQVVEAAAGGFDTVYASTGWTIGAGQEIEALRANAGAVGLTLTGNDLANNVYGGAGADHLYGGGGNDLLNGGQGADTLEGGAGNDQYYVDAAGDVIVEAAGDGFDTVFASVVYTLGAGQEIETIRSNAGTTGLLLIGNEGANSFVSGLGNDTMRGGGGNDTFYVDGAGDLVVEAAGGGTDSVVASAAYTLGAGQEIETLRAAAGATGLSLTGNAIGNTIAGGAGDDSLSGGGGTDTLTGNGGHDTFVFATLAESPAGAARDTVTDFAPGTDLVDLHGIQAVAGAGTDQAFAWLGTGAFTGTAGQLHQVTTGSGASTLTLIEGDVNGDALADFQIALKGNLTLAATDFML